MTRAAETHRAQITPAPSSHGARRRRPPLALTGVALAALLLPAVHAPHLRLVWNASASLPTGLYAIEPEADMRVGDLALVRPTPALEAFMADRHYVERHVPRSEEHTSELQSLMRISYAVFCLKKKKNQQRRMNSK